KILVADPTDSEEQAQSRGKKYICNVVPELGFIYDPRTTQIHSRVIPIGSIDGHPHVDKRYLDLPRRENLPKYTDWQEAYDNPQDLAQEYDEQWHNASRALLKAWNHIRCVFADAVKKAGEKKSIFGLLRFKDTPPVNFPPTIHGTMVSVAASGFSLPIR